MNDENVIGEAIVGAFGLPHGPFVQHIVAAKADRLKPVVLTF